MLQKQTKQTLAATALDGGDENGFVPLQLHRAFGVATVMETRLAAHRSQWRIIAVNNYCRLPDAISSTV